MRFVFKLFFLLLMLVLSGCTGKWVANELPEKNLSVIKTSYKVPLQITDKTKAHLTIHPPLYATKHMINFNAIDESLELVGNALNKSLKMSNYFELESDEGSYMLDVVLYPNKSHKIYLLGLLGYFASAATVPFPMQGDEIECRFYIYSPSGVLLKRYIYSEMIDSGLTVISPLALIKDKPDTNIVEVLMDKFVSNFIHDIERDNIMKYTDSANI